MITVLANQLQILIDYGPMEMGTPSRTFQLLMDSGSADLWVGAEDCQCDDGTSCVRSSNTPTALHLRTLTLGKA